MATEADQTALEPGATTFGPLVAADRSDEVADELVRALADVLDVREVFPRVSEISSRLLPHERLTMTFHDGQAGSYVLHASSNADGPMAVRATGLDPEKHGINSFT